MANYIEINVNGKIYEVEFNCRVETNRGWENASMSDIPFESLIEALEEISK